MVQVKSTEAELAFYSGWAFIRKKRPPARRVVEGRPLGSMAVFTVFRAEAGEFVVGASWVAIDVTGVVLAPGEIHVMPSADLLVIGAGARADEAHGVAAATFGA